VTATQIFVRLETNPVALSKSSQPLDILEIQKLADDWMLTHYGLYTYAGMPQAGIFGDLFLSYHYFNYDYEIVIQASLSSGEYWYEVGGVFRAAYIR